MRAKISRGSITLPAAPGNPMQRYASALTGRPLFWIALVGAIASWPIVWALRAPVPGPLPVIATLPRFELLDQSGAAFGSKDLDGRVWVASFIFTRCATVCPLTTATMARVQSRTRQLVPDFHLISFSVDPDYDTPARLGGYARAHHASPRAWTFLTGTPSGVRYHTSHLALVDREGRIRGYYDSTDGDDVDRLMRDVGWLVNRGR